MNRALLMLALSSLAACGPGDTIDAEADACAVEIVGDVILDVPPVPEQLAALDRVECIRGDLQLLGAQGSGVVPGDAYAALSMLRVVEGDLRVYSTRLGDLDFLPALERVDGDFAVVGNELLAGLHGPDTLTEIGGGLEIRKNLSLRYIEGFAKIEQLAFLHIARNEWAFDSDGRGLSAILGPVNLTAVHGDVRITDGDELVTLEGLRGLTEIDGELEIGGCHGDFGSFGRLSGFTGLRSLGRVGGDMTLTCFDGAANMSAMESLVEIGGTLRVQGNRFYGTRGPWDLAPPALERLVGLSVTDQINLAYFEGFERIEVLQGLELDWLEGLHDLDGLASLKAVHGDARLTYLPLPADEVEAFVAGLDVDGEVTVCGKSGDWWADC